MKNGFKMWLATFGVAALTVACGTAMPTASTPDLASGDATGAATALFAGPNRMPQPEDCAAQLMLTKVGWNQGSVSVAATWVSKDKAHPVSCGAPVWSVSPEARTIVRRFEPNVITVMGTLGKGFVVTATAAGQTVSTKVAIGD